MISSYQSVLDGVNKTHLMRHRLQSWRTLSIGLSFLALILLTGKLYEVDREVSFLKFVNNEWIDNNIPQELLHNNNNSSVRTANHKTTQQIAIFHIENFKQDIEILIVELWSARTTLILSLVFVLVYIISWAWMAYAVSETHSSREVSLKTVLLLAVFAAVDIAASAGFVMVRVIMYAMRDHYFPKDMRIPAPGVEHDQMSSSGATDVFVSVIVGFLTGLRVYSVICAVSYYRKVRRDSIGSSDYSSDKTQVKDIDDFLKQSPTYAPKVRALNAHKERERRFSIGGVEDTIEEERTAELKIQAADMPLHMQKAAVQSTTHAIKVYTTEKHIAESVKQDFDQLYQPTWHCIVGRNWGSCVTHSKMWKQKSSSLKTVLGLRSHTPKGEDQWLESNNHMSEQLRESVVAFRDFLDQLIEWLSEMKPSNDGHSVSKLLMKIMYDFKDVIRNRSLEHRLNRIYSRAVHSERRHERRVNEHIRGVEYDIRRLDEIMDSIEDTATKCHMFHNFAHFYSDEFYPEFTANVFNQRKYFSANQTVLYKAFVKLLCTYNNGL
ncbi:unnamed protein product [Medioppia subpectinata]|uniref:Uncharacterized protein n=1 Tax=Medioppia subpectinata TaxID=1979941 RepID=A0A7R9PTE4_9ACAR|nr:unnamed protein product [Medioppia subpectinata]CAG2100039.1 unnamed protein product [Medioppia subpectinata]